MLGQKVLHGVLRFFGVMLGAGILVAITAAGTYLMTGGMNPDLSSDWAVELVIVLLGFSLSFALIFTFPGSDPAGNRDCDSKEASS